MPAPVKIKAGKYGRAIGMLLERGGTFQTRDVRTLIVNPTQRRILEEADLVETKESTPRASDKNGHKKDAG
jgi:hypothetical protein